MSNDTTETTETTETPKIASAAEVKRAFKAVFSSDEPVEAAEKALEDAKKAQQAVLAEAFTVVGNMQVKRRSDGRLCRIVKRGDSYFLRKTNPSDDLTVI